MSESGKHTLVSLTKGFISLLASANGEVDLSDAERILKASKRRLYDVVNVLSGVGLVVRGGKSKVKWIGELASSVPANSETKLVEKEAEIDAMISEVDNCLNDLGSSELFKNYAWVTEKDIQNVVDNENVSLYALMGSSKLTLKVADTEDANGDFQLVCNDEDSQIELVQIGNKNSTE